MSSSRDSRSSGAARLAACHHHNHHPYPSSSSSYSYYYSSSPPSSAFASSTTSSFGSARSSSSSLFHHRHHHHPPQYSHHHQHHGHANHRSSSPTRVNFVGSAHAAAPSVRFSIDPRSISPGRSFSTNQISVHHQHQHHHHLHHHPQQRRTCMCSPTTHPGSFRCSFHRNGGGLIAPGGGGQNVSSPNQLNQRRSAMTNSLVRIGAVEGELVRRALAALIRPSSHQQRRRAAFQRRPSRLSMMSKASDCEDDAISLC